MNEYIVQLTDFVQNALSIIGVAVTLFATIAKPLRKNLEHQVILTKELQVTNQNLSKLMEVNAREHEGFRTTLADHEKRIYKLED